MKNHSFMNRISSWKTKTRSEKQSVLRTKKAQRIKSKVKVILIIFSMFMELFLIYFFLKDKLLTIILHGGSQTFKRLAAMYEFSTTIMHLYIYL